MFLGMSDTEFDTALITAAFRVAGEEGWQKLTIPAAARGAGLSLAEARRRFPSRVILLLRFGQLADALALQDAPAQGPVRDRLFDLLMRRYDALQPHRAGIKALVRALPFEPLTAMLLHEATHRSMRWMLQTAGVTANRPFGDLEVRGLTAVWYWGLRTWERDESEDLSATMATVDSALHRVDRVASWLQGRRPEAPPPPPAEPGVGELDPSVPPPPDDILPPPDATPPTAPDPTA